MSTTRKYTFHFVKQISFLLVLFALFLQPIIKTYSLFPDTSYELVDYDLEDDTEKETKDSSEKDEKVGPDSMYFLLTDTDLSMNSSHFYVQKSSLSHSIEILIPPPERI
jgi:hypothetical protein